MASRLLAGSGTGRQKEMEKEWQGRSMGRSKRSSLLPTSASTPKTPTYASSLFPRGSESRADAKSPSAGQTATAASTRPRYGPVRTTVAQKDQDPPVPRRDLGWGIRTEIVATTASSTRMPVTPRNRLRRKASSADQRSQYSQSESLVPSTIGPRAPSAKVESTSVPGGYTDPFPGSILGISIPAVSRSTSQIPTARPTAPPPTEYATSSSRMAHYMSRQPLPPIATPDLPPPTPHYAARSSSSSTRASESPGPFSRTSTPTSASSYSPGIITPSKFITKPKTPLGPTHSRPPVTRRRIGGGVPADESREAQGLPVVRESLASSSSSSTVKAAEGDGAASGPEARPHHVHQLAPTPPLRLASKRLPRPNGSMARGPAESTPTGVPPKARPAGYPPRPRPSQRLETKPSLPFHHQPKLPPPRPSREGAPSLEKQRSSPVIQSNLTHVATTGHKRRESAEKATVASMMKPEDGRIGRIPLPRSSSTASNACRKPSRIATASPARAASPPLHVPEKPQRWPVTLPAPSETRNHPSKTERALHESPSKSTSRFALFSRRPKPAVDVVDATTEKPAKRGPAAGTGHEGYGKYARRGRSGSTSTVASRGRSMSTDRTSISAHPASSRKSSFAGDEKPELDDFYKDRLEPVIIGGGGRVKENRNSGFGMYRTTSGESSVSISSSIDSHSIQPTTTNRRRLEENHPSRGDNRTPSSDRDSVAVMSGAGWDSHNRFALAPPTLAHRRSMHRMQLHTEAPVAKILQPIDTRARPGSPSPDSHDTTPSAALQTGRSQVSVDDLSEGREGHWLRSKKTQERVKLPRKWNFFQRSHHSPKRSLATEHPIGMEDSITLPAAVTKVTEGRSVAHYAILDGDEPGDARDLDDLLRDIEDNLELRKPVEVDVMESPAVVSSARDREYSMLLPSPPRTFGQFSEPGGPASPKVLLNRRAPGLEPSLPITGRPIKESRLQQVGRIPRVVSKRDRPHIPPPQSFSRPFNRRPDQTVSSPSPASAVVPIMFPELPTRHIHTEPMPSLPWTAYNMGQPAVAYRDDGILFGPNGDNEFISFSSRKGSEVSVSSSSGITSLAGMTAIVPQPESGLGEDEVWNEYDELLDHVASPVSFSTTSSSPKDLLNHFPYPNKAPSVWDSSTMLHKREPPVMGSPQSSAGTALAQSPRRPHRLAAIPAPLSSLALSSPQRSEFNPLTPLSLSDLYAGYGSRSSAGMMSNRLSTSSGSRYSSQTMVSRSGSRTSRSSEQAKRYTQVMAQKFTENLGAPDNLRFSALMTARWLSFDRVLFSPVGVEIRSSRHDKVLVLDGLGNDDWSSYCAFTYPDAIIYNLNAERPLSGRRSDPDSWRPPPNHRQIHHASIDQPFPFPKGFFTAIVFRLPVANTGSAYYSAISECKRVLRPGGYLELSILDMDMVNMGNRTRRAVRQLKLRLQGANPDISLNPISDTVQKMLGRRGFENLNRCIVGVPVDGSVSDSRSSSLDELDVARREAAALASASASQDPPRPKPGEGQISQMVPRVGRWWWSKCYESAVVAEDDVQNSVWADSALLKECEKRETGFRLVICYAQKPINARRRTVSV